MVRQDGKDLSPQHMEALCDFCQSKMSPLFEDSMGAGYKERTREEVMGFMTKASFESYFEKYRNEQMRSGNTKIWADAKSPYAK